MISSPVKESAMTEEEKKRFISMERDIHSIKQGLEEISTALLGNRLTKDGGLVRRIDELEINDEKIESKIEELERKTARMEIYQKIMWTCTGGATVLLVKFILEIIFKK